MWFLYVTMVWMTSTTQIYGPYATKAACEDDRVETIVILSEISPSLTHYEAVCKEGRR